MTTGLLSMQKEINKFKNRMQKSGEMYRKVAMD